ncbi:DUF3159 domain-containing protein [Lapillicoccus jejuensis]|uniref:DUF3159 domain-containing protein n=1 Tax=Lapillicoccus jejuensis TaxID=402171 RepID=UPI001FE4E932|nr:DUF3159 domain-containing protein [Lapillicoccus jejuensis]
MPEADAVRGAVPEAAARREHTTVEELLRERILGALGGWRGALESALPTFLFVVVWSVTRSSVASLVASGAALVVLAVVRLVRRETVRYIGYSALVLAVAAFFALRSGRAQDAFLPGMIGTAATGLAFLVANLARWPVFGFLIAAGDPELAATSQRLKDASRKDAPQDEEAQARAAADEAALKEIFTGWRRHTGIVTVAARLGWVIVGLDVVRLAVMVPLYLAGEVGALGVAKIVLGTPAYLVAVLVMGLVVLRGRTPLDEPRPAEA